MTTNITPEVIQEITSCPEDFKVLRRVPFTSAKTALPIRFPDSVVKFGLGEPVGDEVEAVILDTETSGFIPGKDKMVELGMVKFMYSPSTGCVTEIIDTFNELEDPGFPMSKEVIEVHHITDDMVRGKSFTDSAVEQFLSNDPLIIAHNAEFDRPFFEARFPKCSNLRWACSIDGYDWKTAGHVSRSLSKLLEDKGFFFEAHRAFIDCLALAWLLAISPDAMKGIHASSLRETAIVRAFGAPFAVKDTLKDMGYRWHDGSKGPAKHWWIELDAVELNPHMLALSRLFDTRSIGTSILNSRTRYVKAG